MLKDAAAVSCDKIQCFVNSKLLLYCPGKRLALILVDYISIIKSKAFALFKLLVFIQTFFPLNVYKLELLVFIKTFLPCNVYKLELLVFIKTFSPSNVNKLELLVFIKTFLPSNVYKLELLVFIKHFYPLPSTTLSRCKILPQCNGVLLCLFQDGRLQVNDQLLEVNSVSLIQHSNTRAMDLLRNAMQVRLNYSTCSNKNNNNVFI